MVGQHQRVAKRTSTERPGVAPCAGTAPPPNILVVGDYLFDSTLNGVMDSADCMTDMLLSRNLTQRRPRALGIRCDYFDLYEGKQYEDAPLGANFGPSNHHLPTPGRVSLKGDTCSL